MRIVSILAFKVQLQRKSFWVQGSVPCKQKELHFLFSFAFSYILNGASNAILKMSLVFSVIGDSNVVDNMTTFNTASREVMKGAQVIPCPDMSKISDAFQSVRLDASSIGFSVEHLVYSVRL